MPPRRHLLEVVFSRPRPARTPTNAVVVLTVAGREVKGVVCTDHVVRVPVSEVERLGGISIGKIPGAPELLGQHELRMVGAVFADSPGGTLLLSLFRALVSTQVRMNLDAPTLRPLLMDAAEGTVLRLS